MANVSHFMEDGNFLCGFMGAGMVFEAETEEETSCPACRKVIEDRKLQEKVSVRKKKFSIYEDED